ncbi:MAG: cobalamin biosynthesis protein CbiM [bacterium]|nr:cobalamin biosynthesis protein CbiM [bacterium]
MHLPDGLLPLPAVAAGFAGTGALFAWSAYRIRDDEVPRVALFTAAFFTASLIHFRIPPTSVHLIFSGLVGVVLGRRAFLAFPVGLALQAMLLGHGGVTTIGVNSCIFGVPALISWQVYERGSVLAPRWRAAIGGFCGGASVLLSGVILTLILCSLGEEFFYVASFALLAHIPVAVIEGLVTGFIVAYLERVQPTLVTGAQSHPS